MLMHRYIHFQTDPGASGDGGSGDGGSESGTQTPDPQAGASGTQGGDGEGTQSEMVPRSEAQAARREAQNLRERLKASDAELAKLKEGQMSDLEKANTKSQTLEEELAGIRLVNRNLRVQALAPKVGIIDPEAASALIDWESIEDPNDLKEVEKALRQLVKDKPYLAGTVAGGADGGAGSGEGAVTGDQDMNARIRRAAGRA